MSRRVSALTVSAGLVLFSAAPAFAHDCFNPNKPAGAGVHYELTGFSAAGAPQFTQIAQGKGIGGFAVIAPGVIGNAGPVETHTIGNSSSHETVGGPGSQKPNHACDGKGIDYLDACGLAGG